MKIDFQFKRDLAKFLTNIEFKQKIYQTDYVIEYLTLIDMSYESKKNAHL